MQANLEKVRSVLAQTSEPHPDFICFPEAFLTGYSPAAIANPISIDHPELAAFISETSSSDAVIIVGMNEEADNGVYNTALVIHKGNLLGKARKTMLTGYDKQHYVSDLDLPVFEAKGVKFGIAICHTTSFVEPAQLLRWKGARLLFTPHYNSIPPASFWQHRTMVLNNQAALATLLKMVVVRSNVIVIDKEELGCGDSNIWNMNGELVASGIPFKEEIVIAEFNRDIFREEHWIDRREIPAELCRLISEAADQYTKGIPG